MASVEPACSGLSQLQNNSCGATLLGSLFTMGYCFVPLKKLQFINDGVHFLKRGPIHDEGSCL